MRWKRTVLALLLFGTAFGYLEAAVVSYLRLLHEPARQRFYPGRAPSDLFPLLTLDQLQQALGSLMGRINAGLPVNNAAWTGADNLPGPPSIVAPLTVPAATPLTGANVSGPVPLPRASPLGLASAPLLGAG